MKKIKKYNESVLDPFGEESWDDDIVKPIDYLSIYISYYSIIITENQISKEDEYYVYLNSLTEVDIPYNKEKMDKNKNTITIDDEESTEWLIKINNRDNIKNHKNFINKCISNDLTKYFDKTGYKFELNSIYDDIDIRITKDNFDNCIDKYFFKNK